MGLRCIAAPIFDEPGVVHAAVFLTGPTSHITEDRTNVLGEFVVLCKKTISSDIGGRLSDLRPYVVAQPD